MLVVSINRSLKTKKKISFCDELIIILVIIIAELILFYDLLLTHSWNNFVCDFFSFFFF